MDTQFTNDDATQEAAKNTVTELSNNVNSAVGDVAGFIQQYKKELIVAGAAFAVLYLMK